MAKDPVSKTGYLRKHPEIKDFRTEKQWNQAGMKLRRGAEGVYLNPTNFATEYATYYTDQQVRPMTEREIAAYKRKRTEARRQAGLKSRLKMQEDLLKVTVEIERDAAATLEAASSIIGGKYVVIDTETTGLIPGEDEILQLSIIGADGSIIFDRYFKPTKAESWPGAERVNHISPEDVQSCPPITEAREEILDILTKARCIVGYNTQFDLRMIAADLAAPEIAERIKKGSYDVMEAFAPIFGEWSEKYNHYKWQKLITCADYYKFDWGSTSAHNSVADAIATRYCCLKMIERKLAGLPVRLDLYQDRRCIYIPSRELREAIEKTKKQIKTD